MRIIAGSARGRRLATLPGSGTRPTLERVKEGIFSAVQFWLPGAAVLELFAGSGQLGLEALSRGAARCVFVDDNPAAVKVIQQNAQSSGLAASCRVVRADSAGFLARCNEKFDLILMDPPFASGAWPGILEQAATAAGPGALLLCECAGGAPLPNEVAGLRLEKCYRYGSVQVARYKMGEAPVSEE